MVLCHAETSVACLVQCPEGSSRVIITQAHIDSGGFAVTWEKQVSRCCKGLETCY